ncbi:MAG: histidine kinase [Myxococcota bacterium]
MDEITATPSSPQGGFTFVRVAIVLHFVGWLFADMTFFGQWGLMLLWKGAPPFEVFAVWMTIVTLSLVIPALMAKAYSRIPLTSLSDGSSIRYVVGLVLAGTLVWSLLLEFAYSLTSYIPPKDLWIGMIWNLSTILLLLSGWSALYFLPVFNLRLRRARERELQTRALVREAELASLRSQLRPHFLFNSLNSVLGLLEEEPRRAKDMMWDVASLLRRALEASQSDLSTLDEEIEFAEQYLRCEQVRFGDDLSVAMTVPWTLRSERIPTLLLQPLVENAVKHGMRSHQRVQVVVEASRERDRLVLIVRNTGRLGPDRGSTGAGLGLVRRRLSTRYGAAASLAITQEKGWVIARLAYPSHNPLTPTLEASA